MAMKFFRGKRKLVAIFDIESASVGGALISIEKGRKPKILQTLRCNISLQEEIDPKRFFSSMLFAFENVCEELEGTVGKEVVDEAVCFFRAPWYATQFEMIKLRKVMPFRVTKELVEREVNKRIVDFEKEGKEKYEGSDLGVPELLEKEVTSIRLNGQAVSNYSRKKAQGVDISFYASVAPERVISELRERILRRFNDRDIEFRSAPFASYIVTRDHLNQGADAFILLDITGEMTEVFLVEKGVIQKSFSFPLGRNFLLRRIAKNLSVSISEVRSYLSMYLAKNIDKKTHEMIEEILQSCEREWQRYFEENGGHILRAGILPKNIFFTTEKEYVWWFQKAISGTAVLFQGAGLSGESSFRIHFIGKTISEMCDFQEEERDVSLAAEALFLAHSHFS